MAFFDWGVAILYTEDYPMPRHKDWGTYENVKICAECNCAVVVMGGDLYDASEFVPKETVEKILKLGQSREHGVPVPVMDP
jgi:hypothetical protein